MKNKTENLSHKRGQPRFQKINVDDGKNPEAFKHLSNTTLLILKESLSFGVIFSRWLTRLNNPLKIDLLY